MYFRSFTLRVLRKHTKTTLLITICALLGVVCLCTIPDLPLQKDIPIKNIFLVYPHPSDYLPSSVFANILQLSADRPMSMKQFSKHKAEDLLNQIGVFSYIHVDKLSDNKGIVIHYGLHQPLAYLGNISNTLINTQGQFMPHVPYYRPLHIPTVFLPEAHLNLHEACPHRYLCLVQEFLTMMSSSHITIMDFSRDSYPIGEIILSLSSGTLIRLPSYHPEQILAHFDSIQKQLQHDPTQGYIYDFRFPNFFFFQSVTSQS